MATTYWTGGVLKDERMWLTYLIPGNIKTALQPLASRTWGQPEFQTFKKQQTATWAKLLATLIPTDFYSSSSGWCDKNFWIKCDEMIILL